MCYEKNTVTAKAKFGNVSFTEKKWKPDCRRGDEANNRHGRTIPEMRRTGLCISSASSTPSIDLELFNTSLNVANPSIKPTLSAPESSPLSDQPPATSKIPDPRVFLHKKRLQSSPSSQEQPAAPHHELPTKPVNVAPPVPIWIRWESLADFSGISVWVPALLSPKVQQSLERERER